MYLFLFHSKCVILHHSAKQEEVAWSTEKDSWTKSEPNTRISLKQLMLMMKQDVKKLEIIFTPF